ncbi:hypothetical protein K504DRAFT_255312 [Pleomassaria siparia CBS 279.74]|uniref:RNA ligase domain-containing protein n=1 Tax=Pleomassaria siparia CBS 279.74 TaxID=1314801 RepID=A0A6G1KBS3_9PLEO|nr:hypothetical protein K504DRAFT_255312 [Pleomassaria siparia CBS 279.74]
MEEPIESSVDTTLYPKITNHIKEVVKRLSYKLGNPFDLPENIPIVGTVKLHGTHADILVYSDKTIVFQSRNKSNLLTTSDNQGFATSMTSKSSTILSLRSQYLDRWRLHNPNSELDKTQPVVIAGEWIGSKIQKDVALCQLSKRFVIISVKINGSWVLDSEYAGIEAPEDDIYNISRGGLYSSLLYPLDPEGTSENIEPMAESVADNCPFAESFGVTGAGEGIVWKLIPYHSDPDLWFKTKGGRFKPNFTPAPKKPAQGILEKRKAAAKLAKAWCYGYRLRQGWEYLAEKHIERSLKGIGAFIKWMQNDILLEEEGYIDEHGVDKQMLKTEIVKIAKSWFLEQLKEKKPTQYDI